MRRLPIEEFVIIDITIEELLLLLRISRSLLTVLLLLWILLSIVAHCTVIVPHLMAARDLVAFHTSGTIERPLVVVSVDFSLLWLRIHLLIACRMISIALLPSSWLSEAAVSG